MRTLNEIRAYISELQLPAQRGSRYARLELVVQRERLREAEKRLHEWSRATKLKDDAKQTFQHKKDTVMIHEPWCPEDSPCRAGQPCCECGGTCKTCTCDASMEEGVMDSKRELYDNILGQDEVASLLMVAEIALANAQQVAREAIQARLSPLSEGANDTLLMLRFRATLRDVHRLRVERVAKTPESDAQRP